MGRRLIESVEFNKAYTTTDLKEITGLSKTVILKSITQLEKTGFYEIERFKESMKSCKYTFKEKGL